MRNPDKLRMSKIVFFITLLFTSNSLLAQKTLPDISVINVSGKIIVSWKNEYKIPVSNISIQRSYDSLNNFTSISSVLNPESKENGFADTDAPYDRMYYRLFIAFEGGAYIITTAQKPSKDLTSLIDTSESIKPWQKNPLIDSSIQLPPDPNHPTVKKDNYPSERMYTYQDNSIIIKLSDVEIKKYRILVFDEADAKIFELTNLKDRVLILDKMNFPHSGWYHFEIYDQNGLVEKNRFMVTRDSKKN